MTGREWCTEHGRALPCQQCAVAAQFDGDLFSTAERKAVGRHPNTEAFLTFHTANPHVYDNLVRFTREAKRAGLTKVGLSTLLGRCRWYLQIETTTDDAYRLNDHTGPYYARLIMRREPDLAGMFDLRDAIADEDNWLGVAS